MPVQVKKKKLRLEFGMYDDARVEGITMAELAVRENKEVLAEIFEAAKLAGRVLDPIQVLLAARGLSKLSAVEDFYATNDDKTLFPEYINYLVRQPMTDARRHILLSELVANVVRLAATDEYKSLSIDWETEKKKLALKPIGEGAKFPTVTLATKEKSITIGKVGAKIKATYETLRRRRVSQFAITLQGINLKLAQDMVALAIKVLVDGDGNSNAAAVVNSAGAIDYTKLSEWDIDAWDIYNPTVYVAKNDMIKKVTGITEYKDPLLNKRAVDGSWPTPFGVNMKRFRGYTGILDDMLLGLDGSAALEQVEEAGASLVETQKIIDGQFEEIVISKILGFAIIFPEARKIFKYTTS